VIDRITFALIFVFNNVWGLGVALLCARLLTRVEIVEKLGRVGRYASLRDRLGLVRLLFIFVIHGPRR
jgi:hypothetical protein